MSKIGIGSSIVMLRALRRCIINLNDKDLVFLGIPERHVIVIMTNVTISLSFFVDFERSGLTL